MPPVYVPDELRLYHPFYEARNNFTWLMKARWVPREDVKRRHFRRDQLLQGYAEQQVHSLDRVRRSLVEPKRAPRPAVAAASLRKVWCNELAFASPQIADPLILDSRGVNANYDASAERLTFASWRIAEAYYTVYMRSDRAVGDERVGGTRTVPTPASSPPGVGEPAPCCVVSADVWLRPGVGRLGSQRRRCGRRIRSSQRCRPSQNDGPAGRQPFAPPEHGHGPAGPAAVRLLPREGREAHTHRFHVAGLEARPAPGRAAGRARG